MGYVGQPPAPTDITDVGTIVTGTWQATDLAVSHGGTGVSTLTDDGVLIGSAAGIIRATDAGTAGEILTSGGVGVAPDWAAAAGGGDSVVLGFYYGNTDTAQVITGLGITPKVVMVVSQSGSSQYIANTTMAGAGRAAPIGGGTYGDFLKAFGSGTFTANLGANQNYSNFYYMAWGS